MQAHKCNISKTDICQGSFITNYNHFLPELMEFVLKDQQFLFKIQMFSHRIEKNQVRQIQKRNKSKAGKALCTDSKMKMS